MHESARSLIMPSRCNSPAMRSTVWTLRPREKNDLVLAMTLASRECVQLVQSGVRVNLVPQQPEHTPAIVLADQLNRIEAAVEGSARPFGAAGLVHAPD